MLLISRWCWFLPSVAITFATSLAVAADDDEFVTTLGDIETVSIATGREQPITVAPAIASVFKSSDIKKSGARNLVDLLNMVPGIHIGYSFVQNNPVYSVRGFSSSFNQNLLIMIDGAPLNDLLFGDRDVALGKIPLDIIDRVEVSRGPGSALWGADAFSAVVNIITKTKNPGDSLIALSGGSYDTKDARFLTGASFSGFDLVAAIEYFNTDGHQPTIQQDQQSILDEMMGTTASLAPGKASTQREELGAHINLTSKYSQLGLRAYKLNDKGMGIGYAAALDQFGNIDNSGIEANYKYKRDISESLNMAAAVGYSMNTYTLDNIHFFPEGAFGVFPDGVILNEEHQQDYLKTRIDLDYSGFKKHQINVGFGGENGDIEVKSESRNYTTSGGFIIPTGPIQDSASDPVLGNTIFSRDLVFAYLQDQWQLASDWGFTIGVRYDDYSDYGSVTSPRAALIWNTSHALTTKLLYGRGFRSPTLLETQSEHLPTIESNPDLQPEKLDQIQLVFNYKHKEGLVGRANIYYHETDDQIRQQNTGGPDFRPENVGNQNGSGVELELWWDISTSTTLYSYYAYQKNEDETTNSDAGYSPHHKVFAMLQHNFTQGWFVNAKATYVGERDRIAEDSRPEADTYTFVDLLVRKDIAKDFEAAVEVRNIFDEEASEAGFGTSFPGDMPLPGRNYYVSLSANF